MRLPTVDLETVGAGGGSIAGLDAGGALRVGPRAPAPSLGRRATGEAGRSRPSPTPISCSDGCPRSSRAALELDRDAAARALDGLDPAAVVEVVNAEMLRALRVVSVERGHDPRDFALVAFGGAGPLHACALAEELELGTVLVPAAAGVLSALGLVVADERRDAVRSYLVPLEEAGELPAAGEADLRYARAVVRARGPARARARGALPPRARGALRLRGPRARGRARRRADGRRPPRPGRHARRRGYRRAGVRPGRGSSWTARPPGSPPGGWGLGMGLHVWRDVTNART